MDAWKKKYDKTEGIFGKHQPKKGELFYGLKYVKPTNGRDKHGYQLHVFECVHCGAKIQRPLSLVIAGYVKDCGCKSKAGKWEPLRVNAKEAGVSADQYMNQILSEINGERLRKKDPLYERAYQNREKISEIVKFAKEEGLSYGNYVAKYGL